LGQVNATHRFLHLISLYFDWRRTLPRQNKPARDKATILWGAWIVLLFTPVARLEGQNAAYAGGAPPGAAASGPRAAAPSAILEPALEVLKQAIAETNTDRWKASGAVRDEAQTNLRSIERDVETTLPPLLAAADAAPDSAAKTLPAYRNVEALYDVLLRLEAAGQLAAPRDQASALEQALANLNDGRRMLGDQLQLDADGQERQLVRLQAALRVVPTPVPPTAAVCPSSPAKKSAKPAAKRPATTANPVASPTASH
jgi:hypothetical protein